MNKIPIVIAMILIGALQTNAVQADGAATTRTEQATFGMGCFSCAEAIFEQLRGVESVDPGYSGGSVENPTYEQVGSGESGHAEAVHIVFDPKVVSFDELLEVFWKMHDPTTLNRQGKDVGSHYRSAIFYHSDKQRELARHYKEKLEASGAFADPIVTEVTPFTAFYPATKEHLDFYRLNPENQYCTMIIRPKVEEFKKVFAKKLRPSPDDAQADKQPAAGASSDGK